MKKIALAAATVSMMFAGAASAADMAVKAPPVAAVVATWTGCYVGGNAGWVGRDTGYGLRPSGNYLTAPGAAAPPNGAGTGDFAESRAALSTSYAVHASDGGLVGAQIGCNRQSGLYVIGVEADWAWSNSRNSVVATYGAFPDPGSPAFTNASRTEQVSSRLESLGTFRGRAGFVWNQIFLYGTGGLAIGDVHSDTNVAFGTFPVNPVYNGALHVGSNSSIQFGWVVGAGGEYAFAPNWSVKAEYLYVDLGTHSYGSPLIAATAPAVVGPGYSWNTSTHERDHIVRVGLNYKFWGPGAVVAKY